MSLTQYNKKCDFKETPEPKGAQKSSGGALRFVVQKHDASSLHYDFRLELDGVLKSWAVPKGPSLNPVDKRLAMQVEDHPYDYRNFEGVIPEGNYGGGTVIVWDEGTYESVESTGKNTEEQSSILQKELANGSLKITLHGQKLKGAFSLGKLKKGDNEKAWLLIKSKDGFESEEDITKLNGSVKTGKTIAQVAEENGTVPNHPEEDLNQTKVTKKASAKTAATKSTSKKTTNKVIDKPKEGPANKTSKKVKTSFKEPIQLSLENGEDQRLILDNQEVAVTSLSKLYWKKEKGLKLDSTNYYLRMAPYILPYLLNRPHSLNRHPNGIDAPNFFQKNMTGNQPDWLKTHTDFSESTDQNVAYPVCTGAASLLYMANLGCIEINPWHSRTKTWQQPDWCLIDLDPDTTNSFDEVIEVAKLTRQLLTSIGADAFVKTSGASGIHIYIPLGAKYSYDESKNFAELLVNLVHNELPNNTSVERNPAKRKGKIYLDFLQNRETQTAAAPYSLRPKRGMPVSTPLHWNELKKGLTPTTYNLKNIGERVAAEGDIFGGVLGKGINLKKVLSKLSSIIK